jgi:glutamate-1-semialdehyde 2,1-aminomutase
MSNSVAQTIKDRYLSRTTGSLANDARAKTYLPGGDTRTSTYYFPYPTYMVRGKGCQIYDCDGNQYIDFVNNFTTLIHGHAHPAIVDVVQKQAPQGLVFSSAATAQAELAQIICERVPSIDLLRFTNTGTEATMMAMRAARAFTGKDVILKMDGGYHGTHDFAEVNQIPDLKSDGLPTAHVEGPGIPACILDGMMVTPYNDLEATETILKVHADEIAAIIMEPLMGAGGGLTPRPGYLRGMRELADKYDVLLIFDEIITFRFSLGGFQAIEGVYPDLTTLGKVIGGGFAVGAFGGRREIMERFDPAHPQKITHAGTFNGHNVTMAAGIAAMRLYDQAAIDHINGLGERLKAGFNQAFQRVGIKGQAVGFGSILIIHWTDQSLTTSRDFVRSIIAVGELPQLLHMEMLNRGIFSVTRGMYSVSTAMTEREIDQAIASFESTLQLLKPYAAEVAPHLIAR